MCIRWILLLLLATGCATSRQPKGDRPLTPKEQEQFFTRAQDERRFWMTRYESERGPVFTGAHRLHQDRFAVLPFETKRNAAVPLIEARVRGDRNLPMLIDLSSPVSWMDFDTGVRLGLIPIGPPGIRRSALHVNDNVPGYLSVASRVTLDSVHVETALFYVRAAHGPLSQLARGQKDLVVPAVIGAEFIRAFHFVQLDYVNRRVHFSTSRRYEPDEVRLLASVPMRDWNGHLVLATFIDGRETPILLDTVGDFAVAASAIEFGAQARQITLGDLVLRQVPITDIRSLDLGHPEIPRLGTQTLSRYVVTIDNRRRLVHFERPATP